MTPSKLDLHSLIVFYHVASEESITAAAGKLCLTQPTVTYHIRSLERNVGLKLIEVKRQKVSLTQAGKGLYKYASEIYRQMNDAEKYLENLKEASLRVGISTTFSTCLASAASAFEKSYPGVKLIIRGASSFEIAEAVQNCEVDIGIVVSADYDNPKLRSIPLSTQEQLVLVASPSSTIAQKSRLAFANLCGYPLILGPETSATRQLILNRIRVGGCHMPSPIIVEVNSAEWGIKLVENGEGVGVHHIKSVERSIADGRLKILPLSSDILVGAQGLLRDDAPEHPMARKFIELVREALDKNGEKSAIQAARS
ncbi:MAG: LysR family transcriptional regulator [Dehalococcoidales bacterium]|nr:LysR family transcriptional regulator [Dehalococcoidales bacterium]